MKKRALDAGCDRSFMTLFKDAQRRIRASFRPNRETDVAIGKADVLEVLKTVATPRGGSLPASGALSDIVATDGKVFFSITVAADEVKEWERVRVSAEQAVLALPGISTAFVALTAERRAGAPAAQTAAPPPTPQRISEGKGAPGTPARSIPGIASIVAVASGKGGVGKSTTAMNLALGLRDIGLRVGLLDADIYGPSVPRLIGLNERPELNDQRKMVPIACFGLSVMSIGFLVADDTPLIWRGPMITSAIRQMLHDVAWGQLDVLVVDMPPGTGDAQLTLAQQAPLSGAVIVSTPQDLALIDARRGVSMFGRIDVPILGLIENMSYFQCPNCGTRSDIFGHGGAREEADRLGVPFLGEIPLDVTIRSSSDAGTPIVQADGGGAQASIYREIAVRVSEQLQKSRARVS